jgi:AbrB family looped-hinge helix DNA binding protein
MSVLKKQPATTRMTSKGQIVIPSSIRKSLGLEAGTQFVVVGAGDAIVLKSIQAPSFAEFDSLINLAREQAVEAGLKPDDVLQAVKQVRSRK